jgi:hypothetical protein
MPAIRLPGPTDRTTILGSTGSGKTTLAVQLLATRNYRERPTFILDIKRDSLLGRLPAKEILITARAPTEPGFYVMRPRPSKELAEELEAFFWQLYEQGNCILYVDEGTMISPYNNGFRALLTQGRSKYIEMITLSQRPVKLMSEVFSEATFFSVFRLTRYHDRQIVASWLPDELYSPRLRLADHHSIWYDVARDQGTELGPVPPPDQVLAQFYPQGERQVPKEGEVRKPKSVRVGGFL